MLGTMSARKGPIFYITERKRLEELAESRKIEAEKEAIRKATEQNLIIETVNQSQDNSPVIQFANSVFKKQKISEIIYVVANHFGISEIEILSERRTNHVVMARHVLYWICKELTPYSYPEIGRRLGGRDHTTILHGVRKIEHLISHGHKVVADCYAIKRHWEKASSSYYWGA